MRRLEQIAQPYIDTAKPGDVLKVGPCQNPVNYWTVYRNDRPIHHLSDKEDADAVCILIANSVPRE